MQGKSSKLLKALLGGVCAVTDAIVRGLGDRDGVREASVNQLAPVKARIFARRKFLKSKKPAVRSLNGAVHATPPSLLSTDNGNIGKNAVGGVLPEEIFASPKLGQLNGTIPRKISDVAAFSHLFYGLFPEVRLKTISQDTPIFHLNSSFIYGTLNNLPQHRPVSECKAANASIAAAASAAAAAAAPTSNSLPGGGSTSGGAGNDKTDPNVGAIAGGVVGGVVFLALVAVGIKRRSPAAAKLPVEKARYGTSATGTGQATGNAYQSSASYSAQMQQKQFGATA
ncbi:hypothetical protein HDU96_000108 [Phlyctochytrium bullatum]|nr:hypothetical protein HDU96_000108 [Phlyctochytrium bullatum]